jgi:hypothetical protein
MLTGQLDKKSRWRNLNNIGLTKPSGTSLVSPYISICLSVRVHCGVFDVNDVRQIDISYSPDDEDYKHVY